MRQLRTRPMLAGDLDAAVEVSAAAFSRDLGDATMARRWRERIAHPWQTDPGGAFVAELDGQVIGIAQQAQTWLRGGPGPAGKT